MVCESIKNDSEKCSYIWILLNFSLCCYLLFPPKILLPIFLLSVKPNFFKKWCENYDFRELSPLAENLCDCPSQVIPRNEIGNLWCASATFSLANSFMSLITYPSSCFCVNNTFTSLLKSSGTGFILLSYSIRWSFSGCIYLYPDLLYLRTHPITSLFTCDFIDILF